jgi:hypothetical protein
MDTSNESALASSLLVAPATGPNVTVAVRLYLVSVSFAVPLMRP